MLHRDAAGPEGDLGLEGGGDGAGALFAVRDLRGLQWGEGLHGAAAPVLRGVAEVRGGGGAISSLGRWPYQGLWETHWFFFFSSHMIRNGYEIAPHACLPPLFLLILMTLSHVRRWAGICWVCRGKVFQILKCKWVTLTGEKCGFFCIQQLMSP